MAEYFYSEEKAQTFLRERSRRPVLYAKISLRGTTQWIVDDQRRAIGGPHAAIQIIEDLTHTVDSIQQRR